MREMLTACQSALKSAYDKAGCDYPIKISYPLSKNVPDTNRKYWSTARRNILLAEKLAEFIF